MYQHADLPLSMPQARDFFPCFPYEKEGVTMRNLRLTLWNLDSDGDGGMDDFERASSNRDRGSSKCHS